MKKTYMNPTCKVRAMKIEAILAQTVIVNEPGDGIGGGPDGEGIGGPGYGGNPDVNKSLWDEE